MKKSLLLITLVLALNSAHSQVKEPPVVGSIYGFVQSTILKECNGDGVPIDNVSPLNVPSGVRLKIEKNLIDKKVVISILQWPVKYDAKTKAVKNQAYDENRKNNEKYRGGQNDLTDKYFLISISEFELACKKIEKRTGITFATSSTLLKYRPGSGSISGELGNDFNVGFLVALSFRQNTNRVHYLMAGLNPGIVKITPATTKNYITEEANVASFSPTIGYMFEVKGAQIGIMTGLDILTGNAYRKWDYRGRPWIGFGVGFSLWKIGNLSSPPTGQ